MSTGGREMELVQDRADRRRVKHTKPSAPNRCNLRNENLGLRALLKLAIQALYRNGCVVPVELQRWIKAQVRVKVAEKKKAELTVDLVQQHVNEIEFPPDWEG